MLLKYSKYDENGKNYHYYVGSEPEVNVPIEKPRFMPIEAIRIDIPEGSRHVGMGRKAEGIILNPVSHKPVSSSKSGWTNHIVVKAALFLGGLIFWEGIRRS